jgi:hypothetical protein
MKANLRAHHRWLADFWPLRIPPTEANSGLLKALIIERQKRSVPILVCRERYERELAVALLAGCVCWRRLLSDFL